MEINPFIPLMVPDIQQQDINSVVSVLESGMLIQGTKVAQLENEIASYLGVRNAIAVSNGTATLHLALVANNIGPGDEVIVPALSYIATANVVELVGATPIFVDIDIDTFNLDVTLLQTAITSRTKAIIPVHEFGLPANIISIIEIAKKHNLIVVEDAACALGATVEGKFVGTFGQVGSFSFHPRKAITSGEGGLLITNDDELANKFRVMRNHGIDMKSGKMDFVMAGFNYRMTDIQAALVLSQFQRFESILAYKNELAAVYSAELKSNRIKLPSVPNGFRHTWQSYHVLISEEINRDELIGRLKGKGLGTNLGAQCMPNETYFQNKYQLDCEALFPNAMKANRQGLVLPLYEKLNINTIRVIIDLLKSI